MSALPPHENGLLVGHKDVVARIKQAYDSGKMHHALILAGPEGIGKETLAYHFIRYALAEGNKAGGLMPSDDFHVSDDHPAIKKIMAQSHPHVFTIQPVYDEKKQRFKRDITLDALKGLSAFLRLLPTEDLPRFIIVNPADGMNNNAQNALLKMLEEPPANTYFLLLTTQIGRLLPTIRSRCLAMTMQPLNETDFSKALGRLMPDLSDARIQSLFRLSGGAVGVAIENEESDAIAYYGDVCRTLLAWHSDNDSKQAMKQAEELAKDDELLERLIGMICDRLHLLLTAGLTGKSIEAVIPEEEQLLAIWGSLPSPKVLALYDTTREQWAACEAGYLDRKQVLLQILRGLAVPAT